MIARNSPLSIVFAYDLEGDLLMLLAHFMSKTALECLEHLQFEREVSARVGRGVTILDLGKLLQAKSDGNSLRKIYRVEGYMWQQPASWRENSSWYPSRSV